MRAARIETALVASEGAPLWVRCARVGEYVYQGTPVVLTLEDLAEFQRETARWIDDLRALAPRGSEQYYPPILKDHNREGERYGDVLDVELRADGAELWVLLRPHDEILWGIRDGRYCFISPRLVWGYASMDGAVYAAVIEEISLTPMPYFKDLGRLQDFLGVSCSEAAGKRYELLFSDPTGQEQDEMAMTEQEKQTLARAESRAEAAEKKASSLEERVKVLEERKPVQASEPDQVTPPPPVEEQTPAWATKLIEGTGELKRTVGDLSTRLQAVEAADTGATTQGGIPPAPKTTKTLDARIKELEAGGLSASEAVVESMRLWPNEY